MSPQSPDLSTISITALHASSLRAMTEFVRQPSATLAETVARLIDALGRHPERFIAPCGHDVYSQALETWQQLAAHMRACCERRLH